MNIIDHCYPDQSAHQQYTSDHSAYQQTSYFNADSYNATGHMQMPTSTNAYPDLYAASTSNQQPYQPAQHQAAPERSYTLGGGAYDSAATLSAQDPYADDAYHARYSGSSHLTSPYSPLPTPSASHIDTSVTAASSPTGPRGPRSPTTASPQSHAPTQPSQPVYDDQPPVYDVATAQPPGQYDSKH